MEAIFERVAALDVHKARVTACVRVPEPEILGHSPVATLSHLSTESVTCDVEGE